MHPATPPSARWRRAALVAEPAHDHDGVLSRRELAAIGVTRHDVRHEVDAGRWRTLGRQTVGVQPDLGPRAMLWRAVWEAGASARLDGVSALLTAGMQGWQEPLIHVSLPRGSRRRQIEGVRGHLVRQLEPCGVAGLPRTRPEIACVRAALWAISDRQAVTLLAMPVQQRIIPPSRLQETWNAVQRCDRRQLLDQVIADICDGVQSLNELDFAALCVRRGLPRPSRQVVRKGPKGRIYLDVAWEDLGVVVEVDGIQHRAVQSVIDDALRDNLLALGGEVALRIPVLGMRLCPDQFMDQVEHAVVTALARKR